MSEIDPLGARIAALRESLESLERVVICFSGGVDSSFLLAQGLEVLGKGAVALTAVSPSLAPEEGEGAARLARRLGAQHIQVDTFELDDPRYAANPVSRCYFCKSEVYGRALKAATELGIGHVLDGFNAEDREDLRPGRRAARELGVRSPLCELGFRKADVREAARRMGLPVWDKPALACLSSRFPYGTPITPARLARVARCERFLHRLGFRVARVRYHGELARIEVGRDELARLRGRRLMGRVRSEFHAAGFPQVAVDWRGYRPGSLNEGLRGGASASAGSQEERA